MGNRLLPQGRVGALCGHFDARSSEDLRAQVSKTGMNTEQTRHSVPLGLDISGDLVLGFDAERFRGSRSSSKCESRGVGTLETGLVYLRCTDQRQLFRWADSSATSPPLTTRLAGRRRPAPRRCRQASRPTATCRPRLRLFDLLGSRASGDRRCEIVVLQDPGHGHLGHREALGFSERRELLNAGQHLVGQ